MQSEKVAVIRWVLVVVFAVDACWLDTQLAYRGNMVGMDLFCTNDVLGSVHRLYKFTCANQSWASPVQPNMCQLNSDNQGM